MLGIHSVGASLGGSMVNNPPANAGDAGLIPGSGRSPEEGNDDPFQYFCLENPMDGGAWWATVDGGRKELTTTYQLTNITINSVTACWVLCLNVSKQLSFNIYHHS